MPQAVYRWLVQWDHQQPTINADKANPTSMINHFKSLDSSKYMGIESLHSEPMAMRGPPGAAQTLPTKRPSLRHLSNASEAPITQFHRSIQHHPNPIPLPSSPGIQRCRRDLNTAADALEVEHGPASHGGRREARSSLDPRSFFDIRG